MFKKPLIYFNPDSEEDRLNEIKKCIAWFAVNNSFCISKDAVDKLGLSQLSNLNHVDVFINELEAAKGCDSVISLGGDGTVLRAVKLLDSITGTGYLSNTPILPVNLGTVGFICPFVLSDLYNLEFKSLRFSERSLLKISGQVALNEVVLRKKGLKPETFTVYKNKERVLQFRGDGCIIATPTGSTAYNFSCGGSIIDPSICDSLVSVCPISSIDASAKPIILRLGEDDDIIMSALKSSEVYADGILSPMLNRIVTVGKLHEKIKLAIPQDFNYFNLLREKLGWARLSS